MATDLLKKYYNNPTKSYIYTNLTCNTPDDSEVSFDINDSQGQITNNNDILSSIDLSDIHVEMNQYTNDMKVIEPYGYIYVRGIDYGETYASKSFGRIYGEITEREDWMYKGVLFFVIKYLDVKTWKRVVKSLKIKSTPDKTFIEVCNEYFTEQNIPIESSYDNGYVTFTSTIVGYDFWIDHVLFWNSETDVDLLGIINEWIVFRNCQYKYGWDDDYIEINNVNNSNPYLNKNVYSSVITQSDYSRLYNLMNCLDTDFNNILEENKVLKIYLYEDFSRYVGPKKYKNGAMLGCVVKATYPEYNAEDIDESSQCLKMAHLVDRIQEFYAVPESLFTGTFVGVRKLIDVDDRYISEYDNEIYEKWNNPYGHINGDDDWIDSDEVPQIVPEMMSKWISSSVKYNTQAQSIYKDVEDRECMGLKGYCAYLSKTGGWSNIGQFYARTTVPDNEADASCKNLIPSFVIYNPNSFPVKVNYLTFAQ